MLEYLVFGVVPEEATLVSFANDLAMIAAAKDTEASKSGLLMAGVVKPRAKTIPYRTGSTA